MSVSLECKKVKRTGFLPAFIGGGILAAAVPVANMAVRSEMYLNQPGSPIQILLGANWQMMSMLNVLLAVAGACLLYHTEYADNAMQKMKSLPIREPCIILSLLISEACKNMWVSLGVGVVCVFTATILPTTNFSLSLFPFAMPFQIFAGTDITQSTHYICGTVIELAVCGLAQLILVKVRRSFE